MGFFFLQTAFIWSHYSNIGSSTQGCSFICFSKKFSLFSPQGEAALVNRARNAMPCPTHTDIYAILELPQCMLTEVFSLQLLLKVKMHLISSINAASSSAVAEQREDAAGIQPPKKCCCGAGVSPALKFHGFPTVSALVETTLIISSSKKR